PDGKDAIPVAGRCNIGSAVAPDGTVTPPPMPGITLEEAKAQKIAEINAAFEAHVSPVRDAYPESERETWHVQLREAMAYSADPQAETPLLSLIAMERNLSVAELVSRVLAKYEQFCAIVAPAVGRR